MIRRVFVEDPDGAIRIAIRESHCEADPPHNNPSRGVFQLQGHGDLLAEVCLDADPLNPVCNIEAAHLLYLGEGGWYPAWRATA